MTCIRRIFVFLIIFQSIAPPPSHAQSLGVLDSGKGPNAPTLATEYIYRNSVKDRMMPVYVLGAVNRPGLYHIPEGTDLVTLLAISGGSATNADLGDVQIKNSVSSESRSVDLEDVLESSRERAPDLTRNDVVHVPTRKPLVSENVVQIIAITSGILGIVLSAYAISLQNR